MEDYLLERGITTDQIILWLHENGNLKSICDKMELEQKLKERQESCFSHHFIHTHNTTMVCIRCEMEYSCAVCAKRMNRYNIHRGNTRIKTKKCKSCGNTIDIEVCGGCKRRTCYCGCSCGCSC